MTVYHSLYLFSKFSTSNHFSNILDSILTSCGIHTIFQPQPKGWKTSPTSVYFWWIREADSLASNHHCWVMIRGRDFPLGHPCCHFRLMDILFPKLCMLQLLSPCADLPRLDLKQVHISIWGPLSTLWLLLYSCLIPQNSATFIGLLLQKPHITTSELRCELRSRPLPAIYVLSWLLADVPPISKPLKPDAEEQHGMLHAASCSETWR